MEECDKLCTRLAILVDGMFRYFGTLENIKNKFGRDFGINILTRPKTDIVMLMWVMQRKFQDIRLVTASEDLLQYDFPLGSASLAYVFGTMESLKNSYEIQEYIIMPPTLEQIFVDFAQQEGVDNPSYTSLMTMSIGMPGQ